MNTFASSHPVCDYNHFNSGMLFNLVGHIFATWMTSNSINSDFPSCSKCSQNAMNAQWFGDVQAFIVKWSFPLYFWYVNQFPLCRSVISLTCNIISKTQVGCPVLSSTMVLWSKGEALWTKGEANSRICWWGFKSAAGPNHNELYWYNQYTHFTFSMSYHRLWWTTHFTRPCQDLNGEYSRVYIYVPLPIITTRKPLIEMAMSSPGHLVEIVLIVSMMVSPSLLGIAFTIPYNLMPDLDQAYMTVWCGSLSSHHTSDYHTREMVVGNLVYLIFNIHFLIPNSRSVYDLILYAIHITHQIR